MVPWLLDAGVDPDSRMGAGDNTPLMHVASEGDVEIMTILLQYGADSNSKNDHNERPLGFACAWNQLRAAELLLQHGAEVNALEENVCTTYLDWATTSQHNELIELLRSHGGLRYGELATRDSADHNFPLNHPAKTQPVSP